MTSNIANKITKRLRREFNRYLSSLTRRFLRVSQPHKAHKTLISNEVFSFCDNRFKYIGKRPYWCDFRKIELRDIGYDILSEVEVIDRGIIVEKDGTINLESTFFQKEYLFKLQSNHKVFFRKFLNFNHLDNAIILSNYLDKNYYHWMMESIGRLTLVDQQELMNYNIVIDDNAPKFALDSLVSLFDLPKERIHLRTRSRIKVSKLLLPFFPFTRNDHTRMTGLYSPKVIQKIHALSLSKTSKNYPRNNFIISRKQATQRRILNIEPILDRYPDLNFNVVYLEDLPFNEQMQLFRNADIVIATHGAGLVNLLFSEDARIIEFFPSNRTNRDAFYFYQISQALNLEHTIIEYEAINEEQDIILNKNHFDIIDQIITRKDSNF